jgi:hypothetical protein
MKEISIIWYAVKKNPEIIPGIAIRQELDKNQALSGWTKKKKLSPT